MAFTGKGYGTVSSSGVGKTLEQLKTFCRYHGWQETHTTGLAALVDFINDTIYMICQLAPWPSYFRADGKEQFTKGTQTISNIEGDGSTITVTTASAHGWSVGDIFDITATTNYNDTNLTIASTPTTTTFTYSGSTTDAETSGTVKRYDRETLTESEIIRMGSIINASQSAPLTEISLEEWLYEYRYHGSTGTPNRYALEVYTSAGDHKMRMYVYPKPTETKTYYYTYQVGPALLVEDSDTTDLPDRLVWLLHRALMLRLKERDKDPTAGGLYTPDFMALVARAYNSLRPSFMPIVKQDYSPLRLGKWPLRWSEKEFTS